jgi:DNA-binding HxlR family transcriptional regulator
MRNESMLKPEKYDPLNRSIGHVLDIIGKGWAILIIREAYFGSRRFEDFQQRLGVARNILTNRLKKLCENEVLERVPIKKGAKRHEYLLTKKGKALTPLLIALTQWGDKWVLGDNSEAIIFLDREFEEPVADIRVYSSRGRQLSARDIIVSAGPGASPEAKNRIDELNLLFESGD